MGLSLRPNLEPLTLGSGRGGVEGVQGGGSVVRLDDQPCVLQLWSPFWKHVEQGPASLAAKFRKLLEGGINESCARIWIDGPMLSDDDSEHAAEPDGGDPASVEAAPPDGVSAVVRILMRIALSPKAAMWMVLDSIDARPVKVSASSAPGRPLSMVEHWLERVMQNVSLAPGAVDVRLTATHLTISPDLRIRISRLPAADRWYLQGVFSDSTVASPGAGFDSAAAALDPLTRVPTAKVSELRHFQGNRQAALVAQRIPLALALLWAIALADPGLVDQRWSRERYTRLVVERMHMISRKARMFEFETLLRTRLFTNLMRACDPCFPRNVLVEVGAARVYALYAPCRAQVAAAADVLKSGLVIQSDATYHSYIRALVNTSHEASQGESCALVRVMNGEASFETLRVPVSRIMSVALCLLSEMFTAAAATGATHERPNVMPLPATLLAAVHVLMMGFEQIPIERGLRANMRSVFESIHNASSDDALACLPYVNVFCLPDRDLSARSGILQQMVHVQDVIRALAPFPEALEVSLMTWVHVSRLIASGAGPPPRLLNTYRFTSALNALISMDSSEAQKQQSVSLAQRMVKLLVSFHASHPKTFERAVVWKRFYASPLDVMALCDSLHESAYTHLLTGLSRASPYPVSTVVFDTNDVNSFELFVSWRELRKAIKAHDVSLASVMSNINHVHFEMCGMTCWSLPACDLDLYVLAAPLLQHSWRVPCAENAIKLWDNPNLRLFVLAWCARRLGYGLVTKTQVDTYWVDRVQNRIGEASSGNTDIMSVFRDLCQELTPCDPGECGYPSEARSRAYGRCKAIIDSRHSKDALFARLFCQADGLFGSNLSADDATQPPPRLCIVNRADALNSAWLYRSAHLFVSMEYYTALV